MILINNKLLFYGGYCNGKASDKLIIIDILSNKILLDSNNHKCINFNSSILKRYVCGCYQYNDELINNMGCDGWQAYGDIIMYDISHNKWKKIISKSKAHQKGVHTLVLFIMIR